MRKRIKLILAWLMTRGSTAGIVASQLDLVGTGEPKIVLQLSWAALLFTGIDGIMLATEDPK